MNDFVFWLKTGEKKNMIAKLKWNWKQSSKPTAANVMALQIIKYDIFSSIFF